ncbi:hypothetical protein CJ186_07340 [Actinomyces graevenitzii]|uniref:DUF2207 family protein n=1 Tax=Actinomyces graevenitzii TaxID=55565 RepID=UPI000C80E6F3|nr:DUF2207 domain-containing protein [Actinomyces graevenitzii]PMC91158.1 hypothetical protein CJ186_07340 [Actinomyces graevenitzii]
MDQSAGISRELFKALIKATLAAVLGIAVVSAIAWGNNFYKQLEKTKFDNAPILYTNLQYSAYATAERNLNVTEDVTIRIKDTRSYSQMFQLYELKQGQQLKDVTVTDLDTNQELTKSSFTDPSTISSTKEWDEQYAGKTYVRIADSSTDYNGQTVNYPTKVEIGWNIKRTSSASALHYRITMSFTGGGELTNDIVKVLWSPISDKNTVPIKHLSIDFTMPKQVPAKRTWMWLHYDGVATGTPGGAPTTNYTIPGDPQAASRRHYKADFVKGGKSVTLAYMWDASTIPGYTPTATPAQRQQAIDEAVKARLPQERPWWLDWLIPAGFGVCVLIAAVGLYGAFSSRRAAQAQFVVPDMLVTQMPNLSPAVIAEFSGHVFPSKAKQKNRRTRQLTSTLLSLTNAGLVNICPGDAQRYRYLDLRVANAQQVAQAARSGAPLQHGQWTIALTGKQAGRLYPSQQALLAALFMISNKLRASQFDLAQMRAVLKNNESTSSGMRKFARAADKEYLSANLRTSCGELANGCSMLLWLTIFAFSLYSVARYNPWVWAVPGFCFVAAFMRSYNVSTCYTQRGLIVGGQMRAYCAYLTNSAMYAPTTPQQYRSDLANAAAVGMAAKVQDALVPLGAQMMASQQVAYSWDDAGPGLYNLDLTRDLDYGFQPVTSVVVWQTSSSVSYSSSSSSSGGFSSSSSYGGGSFGGR